LRPEFPHAEHRQAATPADRQRVLAAARLDLAARRGGQQQVRHGMVDRRLGERGKCSGHALQGPRAGEVGRRHDQRRLPLHPPQHRGDGVARRGRIGTAERRERQGERVVVAALGAAQQHRGFAQREVAEEWAVAAEQRQQRRTAWVGREGVGGVAGRGKGAPEIVGRGGGHGHPGGKG